MRQFYETYRDDEKVAPLVRQLPWSHNLLILGRCNRPEEREFYLRMAIQERWNKRELERQLSSALFERVVLSPPKVSPPLERRGGDVACRRVGFRRPPSPRDRPSRRIFAGPPGAEP
jgi:predicted nuclease of restriction endonuclease-like (RecB) superfamily